MSIKHANKNINTKSSQNSLGFTLVELSIVIIIFGIIATLYINMYRVWQESKNFYIVESNIDNAFQAISLFRADSSNQRYPCPADPALVPGDVGYGVEDCTLAAVAGENGTADPVLVGVLPLTVFKNSTGAVDMSPDIVSTLKSYVNNRQLESISTEDPWNRNFVYAVTQSLTDSTTFDFGAGSIRLQDEGLIDTGGTNGNAHFAIVSVGKNADLGCAAAGRNNAEIENCDGDGSFIVSILSTSDNLNNYYDDLVRFKRNQSVTIWQNVTSTDSTSDADIVKDAALANGVLYIGDRVNYDATAAANNLGSGTRQIRLDVDGNVLAQERVGADVVCTNNDTTNCFRPETLYNLECPDVAGRAQYMRGVSIVGNNLEPDCGDIEFENVSFNCPNADGRVRIIYSNGAPPVCERPQLP